MAELGSEATNLFQELFYPKQPARDGTADVRDVNNIDPNAKNHHIQTSNTLVLSHDIDNGILSQTGDSGNFSEVSPSKGDQSNVTLNNIENLKNKTESSGGQVSITNPDNKTDNKRDDNHTGAVNGSANAAIRSDGSASRKQKRGISFPKESFISGYFEPPDPWKNAPAWTTEDLIAAYKKSCEIHGTKPIARVVQQLQTVSSPGKREELLSLKGEKLDQKQCESIEEILRRVQFKLLDLEASHLDDECAVALFDMIEYYESACQLNISFNKNIQARGWQACSRLVRRTPSLTYLDMRSCDLNDRTIPIFGRALKLGCHLTILHMENMSLSGRPLVILVAALKMNETLQELFLAENKLMPTDGVQLGNLLRYNHKLSLLDLRNNHLQDVGTSHICDGLMEQTMGRGLRTLVLWNNSVNYQAMPALGRALAANESLETLNIGHNSITNEGVHLLKDGLLKTNSLLRLGLQGTRITDEGAVALAEYIADSTILLRIDLRDNDVKTGGLMALSHAMRVNTSVTRIDLDKDPKKESGMKDYAEQQSRLLRDILTFQQRNVQAALEREEEERAKLEEKAKAAAAAREREEENMQESESSGESSNNESFTLIEEEEALDKDVGQEKDIKDEENARVKEEDEDHRESGWAFEEPDGCEEVKLRKEEVKPQNRPSNLFPYMGLHPQESLDSPMPTSNENPLVALVSSPYCVPHSDPVPCPASDKDKPRLTVGSAPAEMILSPQYFPKQIARKIFSVSRVDESSPCFRLSTSAPPDPVSSAFDPLCVSSVPVVSSTSSSTSAPLFSSPLLLPQCASGVSQHSESSLPTSVSPSAALFQDLADETVKHMVSPDIDIDVKSLLAKTVKPNSLDRVGDDDNLKGNIDEVTKNVSVENGAASSSTETTNTDTEIPSVSELAAESDELPAGHSDAESCDTPESSVAGEGGTSELSSTPCGEDNTENSGEDNVVVSGSAEGENGEVLTQNQTAGLQQNVGHPADSSDMHHLKNSSEMPNTSLSSDSTQSPTGEIVEKICEEEHSDKLQGNDDLKEIPEKDVSKREECMNSAAVADSVRSDRCVAGMSHQGAGDDVMQSKESLERDGLSQQQILDFAAALSIENTASLDLQNQKWLSSKAAELNVGSEPVSVCLNNSNSPSLLLPEESGDLFSFSPPDSLEHNPASHGSKEPTSSLSEDLLGLNIDDDAACAGESMQMGAKGVLSSKASGDTLNSDPADDLFNNFNSAGDSIDIENVDLSLDEEPWLTVGAESDGQDVDKSSESPKQPDFFTTLSMNGLTQELASALTSLDGTNTCYGDEEDDLDL